MQREEKRKEGPKREKDDVWTKRENKGRKDHQERGDDRREETTIRRTGQLGIGRRGKRLDKVKDYSHDNKFRVWFRLYLFLLLLFFHAMFS